ncbi:ATP-dependent dethiobiotin synthetase BioD [Undibacterium sp. YM2]|uniref:dethiobiotin synthase n=1 Tax=Undibacterium sp. YM2 TaxID=2058625 RepID=UPI001331F2BB|nr:dethiobiotin synthase [Undibacterium sp. YM2]BBB69624.1 ATP-dependent dethiobiotin synthetase BioD [Undibacterium sp. YM2]
MQKLQHDFFVTGTDTEIGKTLVSAALLHAMQAQGLRSVGMKPIAAGAEMRDGVLHNDDVDMLVAAASIKAELALVCPYLMQTPAAPHIVAKLENVTIELPHIVNSYQQLRAQADAVVVEGVGGFCVPLNPQVTTADMAQALDLPVILVVGMRLGCINHALLTVEAIAARGLRLAGWVANTVDANMLYPQENIAALRERIAAPMLGHIPRLNVPDHEKAKTAASYLDLSQLK